MVSGNLNAPTQMIASRAADWILGKPQLEPFEARFAFQGADPTRRRVPLSDAQRRERTSQCPVTAWTKCFQYAYIDRRIGDHRSSRDRPQVWEHVEIRTLDPREQHVTTQQEQYAMSPGMNTEVIFTQGPRPIVDHSEKSR